MQNEAVVLRGRLCVISSQLVKQYDQDTSFSKGYKLNITFFCVVKYGTTIRKHMKRPHDLQSIQVMCSYECRQCFQTEQFCSPPHNLPSLIFYKPFLKKVPMMTRVVFSLYIMQIQFCTERTTQPSTI